MSNRVPLWMLHRPQVVADQRLKTEICAEREEIFRTNTWCPNKRENVCGDLYPDSVRRWDRLIERVNCPANKK